MAEVDVWSKCGVSSLRHKGENEMLSAVSPEDTAAFPSLVHTTAPIVLHAPLHGWLRHRLLLLSFQGHRSGKTYTLPLSSTQEGKLVRCFTRRKGT